MLGDRKGGTGSDLHEHEAGLVEVPQGVLHPCLLAVVEDLVGAGGGKGGRASRLQGCGIRGVLRGVLRGREPPGAEGGRSSPLTIIRVPASDCRRMFSTASLTSCTASLVHVSMRSSSIHSSLAQMLARRSFSEASSSQGSRSSRRAISWSSSSSKFLPMTDSERSSRGVVTLWLLGDSGMTRPTVPFSITSTMRV